MVSRKITALSPYEFENLIFDLLRTSGMKNLVWRTPGADGGRDLEGQYVDHDFSGAASILDWYIEAKRYKSSVDWPTVWNKISYAQSAGAHFLLMTTTSTYSPRCLDEISNWNMRDVRPIVRAWSRSEIEFRVRQQPAVALKYGLTLSTNTHAPAFLPLAFHLAKATMASAEASGAASSHERFVEFSAALAELLLVRSQDFLDGGSIISRVPLPHAKWYPWLDIIDTSILDGFDEPTARALACAVRCICGSPRVSVVKAQVDKVIVKPESPRRTDLAVGADLFNTIALWGDVEVAIGECEIHVSIRKVGT